MGTERGSFTVDGIYVEFEKSDGSSSWSTATKKDPILFVHGGCHGSWCWEKFLPYFAENGWDCYALNWYNHYKSEKIPTEKFIRRSISDVKEEIGKIVSHLGVAPILIGHSMGGLAVQKYAEAYRAKALVLITPVVPAEVGGPAIELPVDEKQPWGPPPIEVSKELFFRGSGDEEVKRFYALLCTESPRAVIEATRWTVHVDKGRLSKVPKLIFGAEIDRLVPHELEKNLAEFYSCEYVFAKGKGHNLLLEPGWRDTASKIADWLSTK